MAETLSTRDEFTVERKFIDIIQNNETKLDRLFKTKVVYLSNDTAESKNDFEWLRLEGIDEENRRNAKEYIKALTRPSESKTIHFPEEMHRFANQQYFESLEKKTRAHIEQICLGSIRIHGTSLSVTLALSILEDKINNFINKKKTLDDTTQHHNVQNLSSKNGFDNSQKSLSNFNSTNTHSPHHRQQQPCLKNFSHNNFNSSQDSMNNLLSFQRSHLQDRCKPDQVSVGLTNLTYSETNSFDNAPHGNSDKEYSGELVGSESGGKMSTTEGDAPRLSAERLTFFTNLAKQIGHVRCDIDEALRMASDDMKPSAFIRLLNNIKEEREIVEKEESENDSSQSADAKLPIKYIELLFNDFNEEPGISSIEELKRRNQARQQCLQQHTQTSQKSSPNDFLPQAAWDSTKKKKTKKKNLLSMPDVDQTATGNFTENNVSQLSNEKLRLDYDIGKAQSDKIPSNQSYKSALIGSCDVDDGSHFPFRSHVGKATNTTFIYPDKRHSESEPRTCTLNKTNDYHANHLSTNSGFVDKIESNQFLSQMDLEQNDKPNNDDLRYIVIDGSNIAMAHGNGKFSCKGIQIAVNYFVQRGHSVMVFVPQHKLCAPSPTNVILDQEILCQLKEDGHLAFTPSRKLQGKLINCYDDRFILSLAEREDGIIVSNDQYRDLMQEKPSWKEIVEKRLLMYTFVKDNFMLPEDPLGRDGPMLDDFLRKSPKEGNSTPKKSLRPNYRPQFVPPRQTPQTQPSYQILQRGRPRTRQGNNVYLDSSPRTQEENQNFYRELKNLFPEREQEEILRKVLLDYPCERDISRLCNSCVRLIFGN